MHQGKAKVLGIIPARAGSKRVPGKNYRPFAGTTLTDMAIGQALEAQRLDRIVVSSDSHEVLKIANDYPRVTVLERPREISGDQSSAIEYMLHALDQLAAEQQNYDFVVIIQPSSPLRKGIDIDNTIELLLNNPQADSAVSIVQLSHMVHPHKLKTLEGKMLRPWLVDEGQKTSSHELPEIFVRNCAVYVFKTANLRKGVTYGLMSLGYLMPSEASVDINDLLDFEFAEFLVNKSDGK